MQALLGYASRSGTPRSTAIGRKLPNEQWFPVQATSPRLSAVAHASVARAGEVAAALRRAERDLAALADDQAIALLGADGPDLEALAAWPTRCAARPLATK
jgi:hypothetical protein